MKNLEIVLTEKEISTFYNMDCVVATHGGELVKAKLLKVNSNHAKVEYRGVESFHLLKNIYIGEL